MYLLVKIFVVILGFIFRFIGLEMLGFVKVGVGVWRFIEDVFVEVMFIKVDIFGVDVVVFCDVLFCFELRMYCCIVFWIMGIVVVM